MKWEKVKLGSLCERILSGGTPSTDIKEYWNGEIPWISSSDIKDHTSLLITKGISASLNPNILPAGNIIVVTRVGLGKVIGNDVDLAFSQDLQGLILKSNIHRQYLIYALLKEVARFKNISRGATIKGVTKEDLVNIEIPLPPLHIQQQIADTLDKADALRRKDQELLNKYDELAKAIFYDMFGDPVKNEREWEKAKLGEIVINCNNKRVPVKESDRTNMKKSFPYYGASGIIDYVDNYLFEGQHLLIGEDGANLLTRSTPIAFLVSGQFWVNNHAHVVREKDLALEFIETVINNTDLKPYITGSTMPKLTRDKLDGIPVITPSRIMVHSYVQKLSYLKSILGLTIQNARKSEHLFQTTLSYYFS